MTSGPLISVALTGPREGYVLAYAPRVGEEDLLPSQRHHMGAVLAVGSLFRRSGDGEPEDWRAWLWPVAGGDVHITRHCDAVDDKSPERLRDRLQKSADKEGPWWAAEDGQVAR